MMCLRVTCVGRDGKLFICSASRLWHTSLSRASRPTKRLETFAWLLPGHNFTLLAVGLEAWEPGTRCMPCAQARMLDRRGKRTSMCILKLRTRIVCIILQMQSKWIRFKSFTCMKFGLKGMLCFTLPSILGDATEFSDWILRKPFNLFWEQADVWQQVFYTG